MRVKKYLLVFSALMILSLIVVACGETTNKGGTPPIVAPAGAYSLMSSWGTDTNMIARDNKTPAKFRHDDHDDRACADCHGVGNTTGGAIDITNVAGATKKEKVHNFCNDCHKKVNVAEKDDDAPVYNENKKQTCFKCHTVADKLNLHQRWNITGATKDNVTFEHDEHDERACADCHGVGNTIGGKITGKTDKDTSHKFCNDCHIADPKERPIVNTDGTTGCTKCHKTEKPDDGYEYKKDINLKNKWNPTRTTNIFPAIFEHDDHTKSKISTTKTCGDCHGTGNTTGGTIDIDTKPGTTIQDKAHTYCAGTCHVGNKKAPQKDVRKDCDDCHDD